MYSLQKTLGGHGLLAFYFLCVKILQNLFGWTISDEKLSPEDVNINKPYAPEHLSTFQVAKNSIVQSFVYNLHFNSDCMINFSRTILQVKVDSNHLTSSQQSLINLVVLPIEKNFSRGQE